MPKEMEIRLSFYAKDLDKLKGALDEKHWLEMVEEAKKLTAEDNEKQRKKTEVEFRKELDQVNKPYKWWSWDEGAREAWILAEIKRRQEVIYEVDDHYFEDVVFTLPREWEVCGRCGGEGVHDHHAFSDGFTESEWAEEDCEFREDYMNGAYDVKCTECGGNRVTPQVKEKYLSEGQKHLLSLYEADTISDAEYDRVCEMERRMGA